jgi:hypothetical protein
MAPWQACAELLFTDKDDSQRDAPVNDNDMVNYASGVRDKLMENENLA